MQLSKRFHTVARLGLIAALAGLVHLGGADTASAYPQFQFSTYSARCNLCHFSPAGGGLINGFGRDEAGDTISRGGNGAFLHGLWQPPDWLALGVDLRGAFIAKDNWLEPQYIGIPMQMDLYARVAHAGFSANATLGVRPIARGLPTPAGEERGFLDRFISREHYLMYESGYWYARAGRFHAPYGLRTQDHSQYIRRYMGTHTLEEKYGLSGGMVKDEWELHVTAYAPAPVWLVSGNPDLENAPVGSDGYGGVFYYERRNEDQTGSFGVQAKADVASEVSRYWLGGVYKRFYEDQQLMVLSQLDLGMDMFGADIEADPNLLLSAHLGMTYFLTQGIMLGGYLERYDPDALLQGTERDSASVTVQYFPYAHIELMLLGRLEFQGEDYGAPAPMGLLMFHYYL